jgi:hypothetical protein
MLKISQSPDALVASTSPESPVTEDPACEHEVTGPPGHHASRVIAVNSGRNELT